MLLFLMLAVAVLTITMLGVARNYRRSILRDREVEMIHRGEQYERAVRRYYKKNGSYPLSIEQLEDSNKVRYLRKRYKDPMTPDGTWQIVHLTDLAKLKLGSTGLTSAVSQSGTSANANASPVANSGDLSSAGTAAVNSATDAAKNADTSSAGSPPGAAPGTNDPNQGTGGNNSSNPTNGGVLGGGPMLGVVSKSKIEGIHSFGEKTKYNEWFFIYDPTQDTGKALLTGPYNPNLFMGAGVNPGIGNNKSSSGGDTTNTGAPGTVAPTPSTPAPATPTQ
jgi:type II secretory pathway pseudopilin PulG